MAKDNSSFYGAIYLITNTRNQKKYIGITTKLTLPERWREHVSASKGKGNLRQILHRAIVRYGEDAFTMVLVDTAQNLEELKEKERKYIELHETYASIGKGYNQTMGGDGVWGLEFTEISRKQMSEKAKKRFSDPAEKEKQSLRLKEVHIKNPHLAKAHAQRIKKVHAENPQLAKDHSKRMKERAKDPEVRQMLRDNSRKQWEDPESKIKASAAQRKRFSDPSERARTGQKGREAYVNNPQLAIDNGLRKKTEAVQKKAIWEEILDLVEEYNEHSPVVIPPPIRKRGNIKMSSLLEIKEDLQKKIELLKQRKSLQK